jgi:hypothetical protein
MLRARQLAAAGSEKETLMAAEAADCCGPYVEEKC